MSVRASAFVVSCLLATAPLLCGQSPELQDRITTAIDRGVAALRKVNWDQVPQTGHGLGILSLAGWALLESGVPADDPLVERLAERVREAAVTDTGTYELSLAICFLDRLAGPYDEPFIQAMGVRLVAGQNGHGGWTYACPPSSLAERGRLLAQLQRIQRHDAVRSRSVKISGTHAYHYLDPILIEQLQEALSEPLARKGGGMGDNSNTQFALMGLWVARRHGVPVHRSLSLAEQRFLTTQDADGGWPYNPQVPPLLRHWSPVRRPPLRAASARTSKPTMTCAGLYALATGEGIRNIKGERRFLLQQPAIQAALRFLGNALEFDRPDKFSPIGYFLFGLEKTAVVYDVQKIGNIDWYIWGAKYLVDHQGRDGHWRLGVADVSVDTSFALLFLKRANSALDLTTNLKGIVKEPLRATLPEALPKTHAADPHLLDLPIPLLRDETGGVKRKSH